MNPSIVMLLWVKSFLLGLLGDFHSVLACVDVQLCAFIAVMKSTI